MAQNKRSRITGKTSGVGEGPTELEVLSMSGECMLTLNVSDSMLGRDLWKTILDKVPCKPGLQLAVSHNSRLALNESLKQQGVKGHRFRPPTCLSICWLPCVLPTDATWKMKSSR